MPSTGQPQSSGDLAYLIAAGALRYRWAAHYAVRALRRLSGFRGDIAVLSDRRYHFGEGARCVLVPPVISPGDAKRLKLRARNYVDFSAYQRVLFLDSDIVVSRSLEPMLSRAHRESALIATDDLQQLIGGGSTWRCLDPSELDANNSRLAVNSGCFAAPGRALPEWLGIWESVLEETQNRPGPGYDQPGLNACMVRRAFPIQLEPGMMWFPRCDPGKDLCDADPSLVHFHGLDRHVNRVWKMRAYVRRRESEMTRAPQRLVAAAHGPS